MSETGRMLTTMADLTRNAGRAASLLMVASILALCLAGKADAQRVTSGEVVEAYNRAQELLGEDPPRYREARDVIRKVLAGDRTKDERAVLLRLAAQIEVELGNFRQAIRDIEGSMATGVLDEVEMAESYFFLGRLYLGVEPPNYPKAIENLRQFIRVADNPAPDAYFYLGQALALTGNFREAIPNAQKAIELSKTPKENHYRLLLFCYAELRNYREVVSLVERMLTLFSIKDEYLSQLAAGYQELGREKDAFLVQAFRYELGFLDSESELVGIADLYLLNEYPYRAASILEKEMNAGRVERNRKNLEKLGNMFFLAREYEEARRYLTAAARRSPDGELDFRIAQTYFEDENWQMAERHFRLALEKGGLDEACQARVLLGHTLHSREQPEKAIEEFRRASRAAACRREASQWVEYLTLQMEIDRSRETFRIMTTVVNELKKASVAVGDDETVLAIAGEAKQAAQQALEAESGAVRQRKLSEYDRARESAMRRFEDEALEQAREDRETAARVVEEARGYDLVENEETLVQRLDETSKRRVEALEEAQAELEQAEEIAEQARAKN